MTGLGVLHVITQNTSGVAHVWAADFYCGCHHSTSAMAQAPSLNAMGKLIVLKQGQTVSPGHLAIAYLEVLSTQSLSIQTDLQVSLMSIWRAAHISRAAASSKSGEALTGRL